MKKPDEIKKGLECCAASYADCHKECPYKLDCDGSQVLKDALTYIQQLEAQNAEQAEKIRRLESSLMDEMSKTKLIHVVDLNDDSAKVIQQLQSDNAQLNRCIENMTDKLNALNDEVAKLQAERDAAVKDLHYLVNHPLSAGPCFACLHNNDCWRGGDCDPVNNDRWQWRGVQKEE